MDIATEYFDSIWYCGRDIFTRIIFDSAKTKYLNTL